MKVICLGNRGNCRFSHFSGSAKTGPTVAAANHIAERIMEKETQTSAKWYKRRNGLPLCSADGGVLEVNGP